MSGTKDVKLNIIFFLSWKILYSGQGDLSKIFFNIQR